MKIQMLLKNQEKNQLDFAFFSGKSSRIKHGVYNNIKKLNELCIIDDILIVIACFIVFMIEYDQI